MSLSRRKSNLIHCKVLLEYPVQHCGNFRSLLSLVLGKKFKIMYTNHLLRHFLH